jgi:RHS repeat-associated protein
MSARRTIRRRWVPFLAALTVATGVVVGAPPGPAPLPSAAAPDPEDRVVLTEGDAAQGIRPALSSGGTVAVWPGERPNCTFEDPEPSRPLWVRVGDDEPEIVEDLRAEGGFFCYASTPILSRDGNVIVAEVVTTAAPDQVATVAIDQSAGTVTPVVADASAAPDPDYGLGDVTDRAISDDGRYVVFTSTSPTVITTAGLGGMESPSDDDRDVFVTDLVAGTTERITDASGQNRYASITGDGEQIAFQSTGDLDGLEVSSPGADDADVFVVERTTPANVDRISISPAGNPPARSGASAISRQPMISDSGRFVVYTSNATNLGGKQTSWDLQTPTHMRLRHSVYVRDRDTDTDGVFDEPTDVSIRRVSVGSLDALAPLISDDGQIISFNAASRLGSPEEQEIGDTWNMGLILTWGRDSVGDQFEGYMANWVPGGSHSMAPLGGWIGYTTDAVPIKRRVEPGNYGGDLVTLLADADAFPTVADPVSTVTGGLMLTETDLPSPPNVYGLGLTRSYNTMSPGIGMLGSGWTTQYEMAVTTDEAEDVATLLDPQGRAVRFPSDGVGGWDPAPDFEGELVERVDGSFAVEMRTGERWEFDVDGRVEELASWDGQAVDIVRNGDGMPLTATSSTGAALEFTYDAAGFVEQVETDDGREVAFTRFDTTILETVARPGGSGTVYNVNGGSGRIRGSTTDGVRGPENHYDDDGRVALQSSPFGGDTYFDYDDDARATTVTDTTSSDEVVFTRDADNRLASIEDPLGEVLEKEFDARGRLTSSTNRLEGERTATYDADGNVLTETTVDGTTTYTYDSLDRALTLTTPEEGTTTFTYTGTDRIPTTVTDDDGDTTTRTVVDGLVTSSTDADGVTTTFAYDARRRLISKEDAYSNETVLTYDTAGRPLTVTSPEGAVTAWTYDDAGRVLTETTPGGGTTTITYVGDRPETITDPGGGVTTHTYGWTGELTQTEHPNGEVTTYQYDGAGRVWETDGPGPGRDITQHGPLSRVDMEIDPAWNSTSYGYDADGNVAGVTLPDGGTTNTTYDSEGRPLTVTDAVGGVTTNTYDADGRLATVTDPEGGVTTNVYDDLGRVISVTDPRGGVTTTTYTDGGRIATVTDPAGIVTTNDYDLAGRLESVTRTGGRTTTYTYDGDGRALTTTTPEGDLTAVTYDAAGRILTSTDPAGVVTTRTWSSRGELLTETTTGTGTRTFTYNLDGTMATATDALSRVTTFDHEARGLMERRTNALLGEDSWTYDDAGNLQTTTDPLARQWTTYHEGARGLLTGAIDPMGLSKWIGLDQAGRMTYREVLDGTLEEPPVEYAEYTYDLAGRPLTATIGGDVWTNTYDEGGALTSRTDPDGRVTRWTYDDAGRRTSMTHPDGTRLLYGYDAASRLHTITPAAVVADTFTAADGADLDPAKWVVGTTDGSVEVTGNRAVLAVEDLSGAEAVARVDADPAEDSDLTLRYDLAGAAAGSTLSIHARHTGGGHYRLDLDQASSTVTVVRHSGSTDTTLGTFTRPTGDTGWLRFQVEGDDVRVRAWAEEDPEPGTWDVDVVDTVVTGTGASRIVLERTGSGAHSVAVDDVVLTDPAGLDPLATYTYDLDDRLVGVATVDGDRTITWTDGRITGLDQTVPGAPADTDVTYDASGRIAGITADATTTTYDYDLASQLVETAVGLDVTTYTYDELGRRATAVNGGITDTYAYDDGSQLLSITPSMGTPRTFTYDGAGRRLTDTVGSEETTYDYDDHGRLVGLDHVGVAAWDQTRSYDPAGALTSVTTTDGSGTSTVALDWDPTMSVPTLLGIAGDTTDLLVGGPVGADLRLQGDEADGLATDPLGSLLATPGTADLVADDDYGAFGAPAVDPGPAPTVGFRGELLLGGLVHLRARDLDPTTGTFTTRDPVDGFAGTTTIANPYHYADNDPVGKVDPLGLYALGDGAFDDGDLVIPMARIDGAPCLPPVDRDGNLLVFDTASGHCGWWSGDCDGAIIAWVCENSDFLISFIASTAVGLICGAAALPAGPAAAGAAGSTCGGMVFRGLQAYANGQDPWGAAFDFRAMLGDAALGAALGGLGGRITRPGAAGASDDAARGGANAADDAGRGVVPKCSFSAETEVLMADGSTEPISEVEVGDEVLATDPETGETGVRRVDAELPHVDQLLTLETSAGALTTTEDHQYWNVTDGEWQGAQRLDAGDRLRTADGTVVTVEGLDWSTLRTAPAYDLDVAGTDTFYVATGEAEVLVHNCDPALARLQADDAVRDNIARGHAAAGHGAEFGGRALREVIDETIDAATRWGTRPGGTRWWYNGRTKTVVYQNATTNSYGDYGTVFRITKPNYKLPDGTIVNPT